MVCFLRSAAIFSALSFDVSNRAFLLCEYQVHLAPMPCWRPSAAHHCAACREIVAEIEAKTRAERAESGGYACAATASSAKIRQRDVHRARIVPPPFDIASYLLLGCPPPQPPLVRKPYAASAHRPLQRPLPRRAKRHRSTWHLLFAGDLWRVRVRVVVSRREVPFPEKGGPYPSSENVSSLTLLLHASRVRLRPHFRSPTAARHPVDLRPARPTPLVLPTRS
jgi:hypothetical protein